MIEDTVRAFMAIVQKTLEDCALIRQRLDALFPVASMRAAMASEPDVLPKWPQRTRKRIVLPTGEIAEPAQGRTLCTTYLRSAYNAGDVALLQKIVEGKIDPSFVVTHPASLEDAPAMYKKFRDKDDGVIKVVLRPAL